MNIINWRWLKTELRLLYFSLKRTWVTMTNVYLFCAYMHLAIWQSIHWIYAFRFIQINNLPTISCFVDIIFNLKRLIVPVNLLRTLYNRISYNINFFIFINQYFANEKNISPCGGNFRDDFATNVLFSAITNPSFAHGKSRIQRYFAILYWKRYRNIMVWIQPVCAFLKKQPHCMCFWLVFRIASEVDLEAQIDGVKRWIGAVPRFVHQQVGWCDSTQGVHDNWPWMQLQFILLQKSTEPRYWVFQIVRSL